MSIKAKAPEAITSLETMPVGARFLGQDNTGQIPGLFEFTLQDLSPRHVKLAMIKSNGSKAVKWYDLAQWAVVEVLDLPVPTEKASVPAAAE